MDVVDKEDINAEPVRRDEVFVGLHRHLITSTQPTIATFNDIVF